MTYYKFKNIGYEVLYPPGCKEINEGLRHSELLKRLACLEKSLECMSEKLYNANDSLLNDTRVEDSSYTVGFDLPFKRLQGLLLHLTNEQFMDHHDKEVQIRVCLCICYIVKIACPINPFLSYTDSAHISKVALEFFMKCIEELKRLKSKQDKLFMQIYTVLSICCEIDIFHFYTTLIDGERNLLKCFGIFFDIMKRSSDWGDNLMVSKMITDSMVKLINAPDSQSSEATTKYLLNLLVDPCSSKIQKLVIIDIFSKTFSKLEDSIQIVLQNFLNQKDDNISEPSDDDGADKNDENDDFDFWSSDCYKLMQKKTEKTVSKPTQVKETKNGIERNIEYGCHHVFQMIFEMFKINERIVTPLLPAIECKLRSPDVTDRKRASRLLGKLLMSSFFNYNAPQCSLWTTFLSRLSDVEVSVREICVRVARDLSLNALGNPTNCGIISSDEEKLKLMKLLQRRSIIDSEETIRLKIVSAVSQILEGSSKPWQEGRQPDIISDEMFKLLLHQSKDRCFSVRKEALRIIGKIYMKIIADTKEGNDHEVTLGLKNLSPVARHRSELLLNLMLRTYTSTDSEDRILAEKLFNTALIPYGESSFTRIKYMLQCLTLCDDISTNCVFDMFKTQVKVMQSLAQVVIVLERDDLQVKLPGLVLRLAEYLSTKDTKEALTNFFKQASTDRKLFALLKTFVSKDSSRQTIIQTISDIKKLPATGTKKKQWMTTVSRILERAAPIMFDEESVRMLLAHCALVWEWEGVGECSKNVVPVTRTLRLMQTLLGTSTIKGAVPLEAVYEYLALVVTAPRSPTEDILSLRLLQRLLEIASGNGGLCGGGEAVKRLAASLEKRCLHGGSDGDWRRDCTVAKVAAQCLTGLRRECERLPRHGDGSCLGVLEQAVISVIQKCTSCEHFSPGHPVALTSLLQLTLSRDDRCDPCLTEYVTDVLPTLLADYDHPDDGAPRDLAACRVDQELSLRSRVKIRALKMLCAWVLTLKPGCDDGDAAIDHSLKKLTAFLTDYNSVQYRGNVSDDEMSHLRLAAGKCCLRIAQNQPFLKFMKVHWLNNLSSLIHDPCAKVRKDFLNKLHKGLLNLTLPLEFLAMFVLVPMVNDVDFVNKAKKFYQANVAHRRDFLVLNRDYRQDSRKLFAILPEYVLPFCVHMLAHHPSWTDVADDAHLTTIKRCLWFVLEPLLKTSENNCGFLRTLLEKIKHSLDRECPFDEVANQKMYLCSDVALGLLVSRGPPTDLNEYHPVAVRLPPSRFATAPRTFRNEDYASLLTEGGRARILFTPTARAKTAVQENIPAALVRVAAQPINKSSLTSAKAAIGSPSVQLGGDVTVLLDRLPPDDKENNRSTVPVKRFVSNRAAKDHWKKVRLD